MTSLAAIIAQWPSTAVATSRNDIEENDVAAI